MKPEDKEIQDEESQIQETQTWLKVEPLSHKRQDVGKRQAPQQIEEIFAPVPTEPNQANMIRTPRSLIDQMEKGYRKEEALKVPGVQLSLFPDIPEEIKLKVKRGGRKEEDIYIGIDMDGAGWRLVETLQQLLHKHSQTHNQLLGDYYMGDFGKAAKKNLIKTISMGEITGKTPVIITTPTELAAAYACTTKPSGTQIAMALNTLVRYSEKNYFMDYTEWETEQYTNKYGQTKERRIGKRVKGYLPLFLLLEGETLIENDGKVTKLAGDISIQLNPIWQRQIATHYNNKPQDFMERVIKAYGKKGELPTALLPFLNKLIDAQHYTASGKLPECTYHCKQLGTLADMGLYDMISPNWVKKREWKRLEQMLDTFIDIATKIGLLKKHWIEIGAKDEKPVHYFQVAKFGEWK